MRQCCRRDRIPTILFLALVVGMTGVAASREWEMRTHDGLELLPDTRVAAAWVKPESDFSAYRRVMILEAHVAFLSTWQHDHNRTSVNRVSNRDMERIKTETARLFREAFVEEVEITSCSRTS